MEFKLFSEFVELFGEGGSDLLWFIGAFVLLAAAVVALALILNKRKPKKHDSDHTHALVTGALCLALSFVLSYCKLFSMGFGGSVTLCSMLPLMLYAYYYGAARGFAAAFAYAILQMVQNPVFVHPIQPMLDYVLAFSALGITAFFPKDKLASGVLAIGYAGFARMVFSTISGAVFFAEYAYPGWNVWAYTLCYNLLTIGIDTFLCCIVYAMPPVNKLAKRLLAH